MTKTLKVAVAGTGYFSQFHFDAWSRCPEVEIIGIAGLDKPAALALGKRFDAPVFADAGEMLQQTHPDIFDVITPPSTHIEMITMAARQGADVVCQKPFCGSLDAATQAAGVAQEAGIKLVVHENFRFQPWYGALREQIENGLLGEIYQIRFDFRPGDGQGSKAYLDRQPYFRQMPRFLVHETLVHYIDVFRFLFGEISSVWATLRRLNKAIVGEDAALIVVDFASGLQGIIDGNRLADHRAENRRLTMGEMSIEGEKGVLSLDGNGEIGFRKHGSSQCRPIPFSWQDKGFGGDCVYRFTRHVVDFYSQGERLHNTAAEYLVNMRIEEAVYLSHDEKRRIAID